MKSLLLMLVPLMFMQAAVVFAQPPSPSASAPNPDQAELVKGSNAFAIDLYGQLRRQPGNLFFSPASITTAFGMAYAGAGGQTAAQMAATLHFTLPPERLHPAMGALLASMNAAHPGYQLRVADALWAEQDQNFLPGFLKLTQADYAAGFRKVDFKHAPDAVRAAINQWVAGQTADKIKDLLVPGAITPSTRLVLTNAIYFKGDWETQFDKAQTRDEEFHLSAGQSLQAPLMHREGRFSYFNGGSFQALEIPYKSGELSMVVLLPNDAAGLPALEQSLTSAGVEQWLGQLRGGQKVIVTLPRFKMTNQFSLNGALTALGLRSAFDRTLADFSPMTGKRDLWISDAVHKAYIDVNEQGTEAAAATGIVMRGMAMTREQPPVVFRADHPFLFLIRDNRSGGVLFMGRLTEPTK